MATVDQSTHRILLKYVYDGAPGAGKSTTLRKVHEQLPAENRSELHNCRSLADETLSFDFVPGETQFLAGYHTRIQIYTVPGRPSYEATREFVLRDADGVIFVADSDPARAEANLNAFRSLEELLRRNRRNLETIPLAFQYNKRDLDNAVAVKDLEKALNAGVYRRPHVESIAARGLGILEVMDHLSSEIGRRFDLAGHRLHDRIQE